MFGLSFSELILIIGVAIVVIGPKELPNMLRKAGRGAAKLRRMAADLRVQSGIDDVLSTEGLTQDINEIRKLARGELDTHTYSPPSASTLQASASHSPLNAYADDYGDYDLAQMREREVPVAGIDIYGALPDTATLYEGLLREDELASDPLYVTGKANGLVPEKLPWREKIAPPAGPPEPDPNVPSPPPTPVGELPPASPEADPKSEVLFLAEDDAKEEVGTGKTLVPSNSKSPSIRPPLPPSAARTPSFKPPLPAAGTSSKAQVASAAKAPPSGDKEPAAPSTSDLGTAKTEVGFDPTSAREPSAAKTGGSP